MGLDELISELQNHQKSDCDQEVLIQDQYGEYRQINEVYFDDDINRVCLDMGKSVA